MAKKPTRKDLDDLRTVLAHARAILTGDMSQLREEALRPAGPPDASETRDGAYDQEFNLELLERDGTILHEVEAALERLEQGVYGRCQNCEAWIPRARLKAVPHARHCIDCQRELERQGP